MELTEKTNRKREK